MRQTRYLAHLAIFVVLEIVFTLFIGITTPITRISLTFVPMAIAGMVYGPVFGMVSALAADLIRSTLWPIGPYFIGFSITAALVGGLYGILHNKSPKKMRIWVVLITIIKGFGLHLLLNTYWISIISKTPYTVLLKPRIITTIFLIPIEIIINMYLLPRLKKQLEGTIL